jgi:hypothetical protein
LPAIVPKPHAIKIKGRKNEKEHCAEIRNNETGEQS